MSYHSHIIVFHPSVDDWFWNKAIEQVRGQYPCSRILIVVPYLDGYSFWRASGLRIDGLIDYLNSGVRELKTAIRSLRSGSCYFSDSYLVARENRGRDPNHFSKILTEREVSILVKIGYAKTDIQIAMELGITETTAKTYRSQIMRKLRLSGTPAMIHFAIRTGITPISELYR